MSFTPGSIVDRFTANGTWTKRPGAKWVSIICIGGGASGGNGGNVAVATTGVTAAGGGTGAPFSQIHLPADMLGATEVITVGAGGIGPAGIAVPGAAGAAVSGNPSSFGLWFFSPGGQVSTATSGYGTTAATSAVANNSGNLGQTTVIAGSAGGTAGGIAAGTGTPAVGGIGSSMGQGGIYAAGKVGYNGTQLGGAGGALGVAGSPGLTLGANSMFGGTGGGGGGASVTGPGGVGGVGGFPGGGGGGGGASIGANLSGAGGNGGAGVVIVTTYF